MSSWRYRDKRKGLKGLRQPLGPPPISESPLINRGLGRKRCKRIFKKFSLLLDEIRINQISSIFFVIAIAA